MLELKNMTEEEYRESLRYNANLVWKYSVIIMLARHLIEKYGIQVYLGEKELLSDSNEEFLEYPLDERKEIYRLIERNSDYTDKQLAKVFYKESEFYPR